MKAQTLIDVQVALEVLGIPQKIQLAAVSGSAGGTVAASSGSSGGSGSVSVWGDIGGTLSNQTDLQSALNAKQNLDATLTALAAFNTNGFLVQTAADTFAGRTIAGTVDKITVTNGDGVAGNPVITIASTYAGQASITTLGTIATGVWQGTAIGLAYGGTGASSFTAGSIIFSNGTILTQDNNNLFWDDTGNDLYIGTKTANSPTGRLNIYSASADGTSMYFRNADTGGKNWRFLSSGSGNTGGAGYLAIYNHTDDNINPKFVILPGGNVGINDSTPDAMLDIVANGAAVIGQIIQGAASQTASLQEWQSSTGTVLTVVNKDGKIGINTTPTSTGGMLQIKNNNDATSNTFSVLNDNGVTNFAFYNNAAGDAASLWKRNNQVTYITLDTNGETVFNDGGAPENDFRIEGDTNANLFFLDASADNIKIAGTAARGTTEGTNHLDIFDGTAPVGTLANGISLYSTAGELRTMDAAGNATLLSPHDKETNEWIYFSKNTVTGKVLRIQMERLMKAINEKLGTAFIQEYTEAIYG